MLEVRHLRSLIAIADNRTLANAAAQVHLSPSALSHQLKALEKHYAISLCQRGSTGIQLTASGQRLLTLARSCLIAISDAERDITRLKQDTRGELRIALECHTCFDWLMPVMDEFRQRWPEVEIDLVAGFHSEPMALLQQGKADLVIGSAAKPPRHHLALPLFRFEVLIILPLTHRLNRKRQLCAQDLANETLITYPVADERIDLVREVLKPAGIPTQRRTAELTIAILQLVASRRGIAALPSWGVKNYVDYDYVLAKRIGKNGLWSELYAIAPQALMTRPYVQEFITVIRERCQALLPGIELISA